MIKLITKLIFPLLFCLVFQPRLASAQEGLWVPALLKQYDSTLRLQGLSIPVDQLYNDSVPAINRAVVLFGGGCTASFVSDKGLLLTNHHCGYGYASRLSTREDNYLKDGFWAMNTNQEIPCKGLTITITKKMVNVTDYILKDLPDTLTEEKRTAIVQSRMKDMASAYTYLDKMEAEVKPFFGGNQYWVIETQTFKDVRLVAFPPNSIGKFGGDIDNWMWPRETGDFSIFRVYANKQNQPAEYNIANVPYHPESFLPISTKGYNRGNFAMVYGYPYKTEEYLTSNELGRIKDIMYPIRVGLRGRKLAIWDTYMDKDPKIFLDYSAKQAGISNGYKKWKGAIQGLEDNGVMAKKRAYEYKFNEMADNLKGDSSVKMLLPRIAAAVNGNKDVLYASEYIREAVFGVQIIREAGVLNNLLHLYRNFTDTAAFLSGTKALQTQVNGFYSTYVPDMDKEVFEALMPVYMQANPNVVAPGLKKLLKEAHGNYKLWSGSVFTASVLANEDELEEMLSRIHPDDTLTILEDPAYRIYVSAMQYEEQKVIPAMKSYEATVKPLHRQFIALQMKFSHPPHPFYPDANQTLRLSFGKVAPLKLENSDTFQTGLGDLIARDNPSNSQLSVPDALKKLYAAKDYGRWADNGKMPVNFLTTCQTTGGNSGSPVLNANGQLIGLNFDRPWQGTMSDFYYTDTVCRNISVDIRYVMFLIQKYGQAGWLLKEMKFVK